MLFEQFKEQACKVNSTFIPAHDECTGGQPMSHDLAVRVSIS